MKPVSVSDPGAPACAACVLCCRADAVRLLPEDDAGSYLTEPHDTMPGERMLAHRANGDCVYLDRAAGGCSIYERRPLMCRHMDCRLIALALSFTQARTHPGLPLSVWRRGRDLLKQMRCEVGCGRGK